MNKDQLQRGNDIQDLLHLLKAQLERLNKPTHVLLSELGNNCMGKINTELEDLEGGIKEIAIKRVKDRIAKLESEFKKL